MKNFISRILRPLALATLGLLLPAMAIAHSFNALLIVPPGADMQTIRNDMQTAFLIAALERDDHANNHADGHLGGLDVYLSIATPDGARDLATNPDIVAAPLLNAADIRNVTPGAASFGASRADQTQAFLDRPADPNLAPFVDRFTAEADHPPGPEAIAAYSAARRIDLAVRELGEADDTERLQTLLSSGNR